MKQLARRSILSYKANNDGLIILDDISVSQSKTSEFIKILNELKLVIKSNSITRGTKGRCLPRGQKYPQYCNFGSQRCQRL